MTDLNKIIERYPYIAKLRGKMPDEVLEKEFTFKMQEFETWLPLADTLIPTINLSELFSEEMEKSKITMENFLGQWGNVTLEELCKISLIVSYTKPRTIFEFGTFNGNTTLQMAMNSPRSCEIYTLDIPPVEAAALNLDEIDQRVAQKTGAFQFQVGHYFKGTKFESKITQLWGDSAAFDFSPYYGQMEVVFIDAAHAYDYVKSDTENALRMLKPGGVILWHNYHDIIDPDVTKCLYEYAKSGLPIKHLRNTVLAAYRSKQ